MNCRRRIETTVGLNERKRIKIFAFKRSGVYEPAVSSGWTKNAIKSDLGRVGKSHLISNVISSRFTALRPKFNIERFFTKHKIEILELRGRIRPILYAVIFCVRRI